MAKKLTIIQQNDTHGNFEEHNELFWNSNYHLRRVGGFSRIFQFVKELKRNQNVLFLDGGDLFHGTAPLVLSRGEAVLPLLQEMQIDAFVPGNWDYAYEPDQLVKLVKQLPFPAFACNVHIKETRVTSLFEPYIVKEVNDVTVGVIGRTYPYVDVTMPEAFSAGLEFSIGVDEVKRCVEALQKENVDLIVLLSHMGLPLDYKLASLVSGIHVIVSGHSHDRITKPIIQNETLIFQSGASGSFLGLLEVTCEKNRVIDYSHKFIPLDVSQFEDNDKINYLIQQVMEPYSFMKEEIVGKSDTLLHRMTLNEAPMDKLITNSYLYPFDADFSFSHGWRYGTPVAPGNISLYDLHTIIPTNPEIFSLELTGNEIFQELEKNLEQVYSTDPFQQKGGYVLRSSGLFMTYKPYNPKGHRIQYLAINGEPFNPEKVYRIISAGEQLFKQYSNRKQPKHVHAIEVIKAYLSEKGPFSTGGPPSIISV